MSTSTPLAPSDRAPGDPAGHEPGAREVVVGVDGSECGLGAVRWATQEAERRAAPLRIVHAAPYLGRRRGASGDAPELPRARQITAQAYTVSRHTSHDVRVSTEIVPDDPATALLRAGATGQLVVLGSTTTGAPDELVLAPVAQRVAARSTQPVVIVPRRRGSTAASRPVVTVLGIGDAEDDAVVAEFAAEAARRTGTGLTVLRTRPVAPASWVADPDEWEHRFPGLAVEHLDMPSATAGQILGEACPSPLLVLSSGHGSFLHRSLDGPHRWLLRHCTSPMALIPPVHRPELEPREEIIAVG